MALNTTPDNIFYATTGDGVTPSVESANQATSIQAAFNLRQRYEFVWADATARINQTNMTTGSTGYQIDTKTEYIYESATWRVRLSYAEYTASTLSVPNGTATAMSTLALVPTNTTDSAFTSMSSGTLTFTNPGVYSISLIGAVASGLFIELTSDAAHTVTLAIGPFVAGVGSTSLPFFRTTAANTNVYTAIYQNSGSTQNAVNMALRVGRLG